MSAYTVVIAEDEKLIRNGIADSIEWQALDSTVVGLAKNGREAYSIIQDKAPDILITDIQMSGGDGLELIRDVNRVNPEIKVIIISGYNSFSYAQQAIQLGVRDYILKPVNIEELQEILGKLIKTIEEERNHKNEFDRFSAFYEEYRQTFLDDFFRDLLFGTLSREEIEKGVVLHEYDKNKSHHVSIVLYSEIRTPMESSRLHEILQKSLADTFCKYSLNLESLFFFPNEVFYTDITLVLSIQKSILPVLDLIADLKTIMGSVTEFSLLGVGVGEVVNTLDDLAFSYQKARTHALFSMISGFNVRQKSVDENSEALHFSLHDTTKQLYDLLSRADQGPLEEYLKTLEKEVSREENSPEYKQSLLRNVLICVLSAGDELGVTVRKFFPDLMTLYRYSNMKSLEELLAKISWACRTITNQYATREDHAAINLMEKAKNYILAHYDDPLLSIGLVAEYLGLTPAYFSRLYKKAYGMTSIDYVTKLRMDKAKDTLRKNPQMKISAIASSVGYNSPSYFNYLFKKIVGMTPKEYQSEDQTN
jgi:two-component system response regulator YesN